jgi:hypothetical protein
MKKKVDIRLRETKEREENEKLAKLKLELIELTSKQKF